MTNFFFYLSVEPPKIIQYPKSQSVPTGAQTTFTVEATGDDLTFQWQKNGSDVHNDSNYSGTDTNTLSIRHVDKSDEGCYRCLVRNEVNRVGEVSEEAKLNVCECPSSTVTVMVYNCYIPSLMVLILVCNLSPNQYCHLSSQMILPKSPSIQGASQYPLKQKQHLGLKP